MSFVWPLMLFSLLLVPLLVGLYMRLRRQQRQVATGLGMLGVVRHSSGKNIRARRHIPPLIFLAGLVLLLLAAARPEMTVSLPRVEGTAILAIDVSNSMNADDLEPTRMEAAREAARAFVESQPRTIRIGVVAFSGGGVVVQPPTHNRDEVLATIDRLTPQGGTSLGQGIYSSLSAIAGEAIAIEASAPEGGLEDAQIGHYPSAVIVLLSDGENTDPPEPLDIAQLAAEAGVRIYPVGIGSPEGAVVEVDGFSVLSQLNETRLQEIASLTNGAYYQAGDAESLRDIYQNIDLQLAVRGEKMEITALAAGLSILLFLTGGVLSLFWFGRIA